MLQVAGTNNLLKITNQLSQIQYDLGELGRLSTIQDDLSQLSKIQDDLSELKRDGVNCTCIIG